MSSLANSFKKMSKRERTILYVVVGVIALWLGDQYVWAPFSERSADAEDRLAQLTKEKLEAQRELRQHRLDLAKWDQMQKTGLQAGPSSAASQLVHALKDWSQDAGMSLPNVQSEHPEQDKNFARVPFRGTGTGSMQSVARFLYRIQTSNIPVRVVNVQLVSRKEGVDDLQMTMQLSTLSLPAPVVAPATRQTAAPAGPVALNREGQR